jgi:hypothetical protein
MLYIIIIIFVIFVILLYYYTIIEKFQGKNSDFESANLNTFSNQLTTQVKVAGTKEYEKASQYALEMLCMRKGYEVDKHDLSEQEQNLGFRCKHTKQTCKRDSRYPSTSKNVYTIWEPYRNECIYGLEEYRKFCYEQDKLLKYNIDEETCKTTRIYCMSKLEKFDGDCYKDFITSMMTYMFGDFIGKMIAKFANSFTILGLISVVDSAARGDELGSISLLGIGDIVELSKADFDTRTYQTDDF